MACQPEMDSGSLAGFDEALAALDAQQLRRRRRVVTPIDGARVIVDGAERLAFCSNDYLGLAQHPALVEAAREAALRHGVGAGASPLVSGHSPEHEALEAELAAFVGLPRALYFYAGYAANSGCIPALVGKGDALIADALNHACLIDGARLSGAERRIYAHNDLAALERALVETRGARRRLVAADAVFSMDGDLAPVPQMLELCERHDALLFIDDAHGFGVLGDGGRGSLSHFGLRAGAMPARLIYMATLGKAAGVSGAFIAGAGPVVEWLMQKARTYMFATAAPAMVTAALRASLRVMEAEGWRRERLAALRTQLQAGLAALPWPAPPTPSAIQPLLLGDNDRALQVMAALDREGLWVPAIRPPTVPVGTARLRITLSAAHGAADVDRLLATLRGIAG
jgi:8-amino-7-oxononanoate synthase